FVRRVPADGWHPADSDGFVGSWRYNSRPASAGKKKNDRCRRVSAPADNGIRTKKLCGRLGSEEGTVPVPEGHSPSRREAGEVFGEGREGGKRDGKMCRHSRRARERRFPEGRHAVRQGGVRNHRVISEWK